MRLRPRCHPCTVSRRRASVERTPPRERQWVAHTRVPLRRARHEHGPAARRTAGETATLPGMNEFEHLVTRLNARCESHPFHVGWYLRDLRTGLHAGRNADVVVPAASTRKVAILMAAMRAVHRGDLDLEAPVTVDERWLVSDSGVFQYFRPGFTITVHDVLLMMIIEIGRAHV